MPMHTDKRRAQALEILVSLLRSLRGITADIFFIAIREAGFSEDEAVKYTGAVMRTASARGYMEKTPFSKPSKRNSSNLQSVWLSKTFVPGIAAQQASVDWAKKGFEAPENEAQFWLSQKQFLQAATVSEKGNK